MDIFRRERVVSSEQGFNIDVDELNDISPKYQQPNNIGIILKEHQLTILHRAIEYENRPILLKEYQSILERVTDEDCFYTNIGVIADRVGSGKSYVILSLIVSNDIYDNHRTLIRSSGINNVSYHLRNTQTASKTNVIVIPFNLCVQWETYIKTFSSSLTYKIINKSRIISEMNGNVVTQANANDIFLVTSTFYNRFVEIARKENIKFQRIIFDEADSITMNGCYTPEASFYWFVTASYGNLLYPKGFVKQDANRFIWYAHGIRSTGFIRNVFVDMYYTVPRDIMKTLIIKNSEAYIQHSIELPPLESYMIRCKTPHSIRVLYDIVDKNIISCLNAGDVQKALQYVNPHQKMTEHNIIEAIIAKYNVQLSNIRVKISMLPNLQFETESEYQREEASLISKEKELVKNIELIKERVTSSDICTICCDTYDIKTIVKCCQNSFCFKCIQLWMSRKAVCPFCKTELSNEMLYVTCSESEQTTILPCNDDFENNKYGDISGFSKTKTKLQNLELILQNRLKKKILIFSNYDNSFDVIYPLLQKLGIHYEFLKGNGVHINNVIDKYKNGNIDVLLANTQYYGSGLNMENTSDIIMFHKFDTEIEKQVIGRAQRFGRKETLNVWYLLHENE